MTDLSGTLKVQCSHVGVPDPEEAEFKARLRSLERKIERKVQARDLTALERIGVPRASMLSLLALTAGGASESFEQVRNARDELRSVARRLDTLARDAEKSLRNPLTKVQFCAYLMAGFQGLGMKAPGSFHDDAGFRFALAHMRALAKLLRTESDKLGAFLRTFGRSDSQHRVAQFMVYVFVFRLMNDPTVRQHDNLDIMANLLNDTFEAAGVDKYGRLKDADPPLGPQDPSRGEYFTEDSLRAIWKRTGRPMLGLWLKFNTYIPQAPSNSPGSVEVQGRQPVKP